MENQKQVSHFPTASILLSSKKKTALARLKWSPFTPPQWETFTPPLTTTLDQETTVAGETAAVSIQKEQVLQKHGKALVIYGAAHFYWATPKDYLSSGPGYRNREDVGNRISRSNFCGDSNRPTRYSA
jgi:hypothetical protein